jgi:surface antigen
MQPTTQLLALAITLLFGISSAWAEYYGESLGQSEQLAVANTLQQALEKNPSGTEATWNNPDSAHSGKTIPLRTFQTLEGVPCREFQQQIRIGGTLEQGYGTACRQSDGSWRIVALNEPVNEAAPVAHQDVPLYRPWPRRYYDPWSFSYPYVYAFAPRHISFSFGSVPHIRQVRQVAPDDRHYRRPGHIYRGHDRQFCRHRRPWRATMNHFDGFCCDDRHSRGRKAGWQRRY